MRNTPLLGPYCSPTSRSLRWSLEGGQFLMSEISLYKVRRIWEGRLAGGTRRQAPLGPEDFVVSVEVLFFITLEPRVE